MTWFWFVFLGIIALVARVSIANWVANWSEQSLKQMSAIGLIAFGFMATFGIAIPADFWPLHIGAAIGGIMGFFAVSESAGRKSRAASMRAVERGRRLMREARDDRESSKAEADSRWSEVEIGEPEPLVRVKEPPLITSEDTPEHILEVLEHAAARWENPEMDSPVPTPSDPEAMPPAQHEMYQSVAQIIARAADQKEEAGRKQEIEGAVTVVHVPRVEAEPELPSAEPASSQPIAVERPADQSVAAGSQPPPKTKPAETYSRIPAPSAAVQSTMARESGPVSLADTRAMRPAGPISLGGSPGPGTAEDSVKREGFSYRPQMVRSRLGQDKPERKKAEERSAESTEAEVKAEEDSKQPAAELQ
jgi:hypothetical protein